MDASVVPSTARILVIEDEALVARELKSRLTQMGWEVVGIAYGAEAPALARETRPDLILTDIHLKNGVDGIDIAAEICAEMDIPVVFLTAYSDDETVARAKTLTPFGYIIKPVENRELQITIEIALYKFQVDRELRETQQLLQTALACIGTALVFLDDDGTVTQLNEDANRLLGKREAGIGWARVLGLAAGSTPFQVIDEALGDKRVTRLPPFLLGGDRPEITLVDGMAGPMEKGSVLILREVTQIYDQLEHAAVQSPLPGTPEVLTDGAVSISQMLIAPFEQDEEAAAGRVESVLARMDPLLRSTDLASPFGPSLVSVTLPGTQAAEAESIALTILEEIRDMGDFSIGVASAGGDEAQPIELFRHCLTALNQARARGPNEVVLWSEPLQASQILEDQLLPDYRQMLLLWNVMNELARVDERDELIRGFVRQVFQFLEPKRLCAFSLTADELREICCFCDDRSSGPSPELTDEERAWLRDGRGNDNARYWIQDVGQGVVIMLESAEEMPEGMHVFLGTLGGYLRTMASRIDMETPLPEDSPRDSELVFQSPRMAGVVESVKLVAPTDANVLIHGESGTGKEVLAQFLHQNSARAAHPFVIVDCGAVVSSLLESELFGHVKGAFTGADSSYDGRLREANGGTVLLDEIGELPLDVQVKLLRFVQDRQFAPVGSTDYFAVDTRIIAATNRDLKAMVESGEFREDLYYRLNVFTLHSPPLRERAEDVLMLARHYLKEFSTRYKRPSLRLSVDAEQVLLAYNWPGNIRELVNVINRAVIMCRDEIIGPVHLGLFADPATELMEAPATAEPPAIGELLDRMVSSRAPVPLGLWLEEVLLMTAVEEADGVVNRAAEALGMPEPTLRRRITRIRDEREKIGTQAEQVNQWIDVRALLNDLKAGAARAEISVPDLVSRQLVEGLESRGVTRSAGARIMGISLPTYRKLAG